MTVTDIPKLYTALAEWGACLVFVLVEKNRWKKGETIGILSVFLVVFCVLQYYIGVWPVAFWIPAMVCAMLLMCLCIWFCCKISFQTAVLSFSLAFMSAEFIASIEWQIFSFIADAGYGTLLVEIIFFLFFYIGLFECLYILIELYFGDFDSRTVSWHESVSSVLIAETAFLISNISYVYPNTPFSSSFLESVFYIRTLVDFSGLLILFLQQERWRQIETQREVDTLNNVLNRQYEQYTLSKENIEIIDRKYHDLKHQIGMIRAERDPEKKEKYLAEMEDDIKAYEAMDKTGNHVLDTILTGKHLYCIQNDINFTCLADGALLNGINVMDICTIFGNALDNAIECEEKIKDKTKRLIRVALHSQDRFVIIRVENYCETPLPPGKDLPDTTKKNRNFHGYGLKSIRSTVEKYGGTMTVKTEDDWFCLKVLIPKTKDK